MRDPVDYVLYQYGIVNVWPVFFYVENRTHVNVTYFQQFGNVVVDLFQLEYQEHWGDNVTGLIISVKIDGMEINSSDI